MEPTDSETPPSDSSPPTPEPDPRCDVAFERMEQRIRAVPKGQFRTINLDIPTIVTQMSGVAFELKQHRELVASTGFDLSLIDDLYDYALALGHCHSSWRAAAKPNSALAQLAKGVRQSRRRLHRLAIALVTDGLLDGKRVNSQRGGNAYRLIAFDVLGLIELYREAWDRIAGKTSITRTDLDQASLDANLLILAIGRDEQRERARVVAEKTLLRRQAYALFVRAYAKVREAVRFARSDYGDVDAIIPSLFAERGLKSGTTKRNKAATANDVVGTRAEVVSARLVEVDEVPTPSGRQLPESRLEPIMVPWPGPPPKGRG